VVQIMQRSLEIYREVAEGDVDFNLRAAEQLLFASDERQLELVRSRAAEMRSIGVRVDGLEPQEMPFQMRCIGGVVIHDSWAIDPAPATRAFAEAARAAGAELRVGVRAGGVVTRSGRLDGLITDSGRIACDAVVLAAGPWITQLWPELPVSSGRGWLLRLRDLGLRLPWLIEEMAWPDQEELGRVSRSPSLAEVAAGHDRPVVEALVLAQQPAGDALLGSSVSPSLRDNYEGLDMPRRLAARAIALAPGLRDVGVAASWYGIRPMTPDGMPIVGALSAAGVYVHGGHGSIGMMAAPATARWLAAAMRGDDVPELAGLGPGRFGD
jgi:glycine/D-amino acid oxidase-like deaminating enzyme